MSAGWWIGGAVVLLILFWVARSRRRSVPLQNALNAVQSLTRGFESALLDELDRAGAASADTHNEAMAFVFALTAHAIQMGGGPHATRQEACALLEMRIAKRMVELDPHERSQLIHHRYQEYGPKFSITHGLALATTYFEALVGVGYSSPALIEAAKLAHMRARLAWTTSVRAARLYLDKQRMAQEFAG